MELKTVSESEQNRSIKKFAKYKNQLINEDDTVKTKTFRHLKRLLADSKDDEAFMKFVSEAVDVRVVIELLRSYGATESKTDKLIFDSLFLLEQTYHVNLRPFCPIVWGDRSKENYDNLRQLGWTLHVRLTSDQVLDYLDPRQMWFTLLRMGDKVAVEDDAIANRIYDKRFILRLLMSLVDAGTELTCRKFIVVNGLSFAFAACSLHDTCCRSLGYVVLSRFQSRLKDLSDEVFAEKPLFSYLIRLFQNSIEEANLRIPHVVSHFLARTSKLLLHPEDPVYAPIMAFLLLKPTINLGTVPEFLKMMFSGNVEHHVVHRHWMLKLIAESMIEPNDYNVLQKVYGVNACLSFFPNSMSDVESRKLILYILRSAMRHRSIVNDLIRRFNLQSWITFVIQSPRRSRWEISFLCQLFVQLAEHVKLSCNECPNDGRLLSERRVDQGLFKMLSKTVLDVISREDDEGKAAWAGRLDELLTAEWTGVNERDEPMDEQGDE